jgi:hypothetical protein
VIPAATMTERSARDSTDPVMDQPMAMGGRGSLMESLWAISCRGSIPSTLGLCTLNQRRSNR